MTEKPRQFGLLLRSQIYNILLYLLIFVVGLLFFIPAIFSRRAAYLAIKIVCQINKPMLRLFCNIRQELRGTPPKDNAIICAKHMSLLDIMMISQSVPEAKFVMKDSLKYVPIFGFYAMRIGSAPVKRGAGSKAVDKMVDDLEDESDDGQIVIYPQGTRVLPGQKKPYKRGAAILYKNFDLPCHMVATNIGVLWARKSPYRYPGVAIIEYLDETIPPGLESQEFMNIISTQIEERSDELMKDYPAYYTGDLEKRKRA